MASNSNRKSGSSGRTTSRKRVVIGAAETVRVRYRHDKPEVESERRMPRARKPEDRAQSRAGKQLSSNKRDERERRQRAIRIRRAAIFAAAAIAVAAVFIIAGSLRSSRLFSLTSITVEGTHHHNRESILRLAAIPKGTGVLQVTPREVRQRIEKDPWIAEASVKKDLPHGLSISVTERVPAAVVDAGGAAIWIVSKDGHWLSQRSSVDTGLPTVTDIERLTPVAGKRATEDQVLNAIKVIAGLSPQLLKEAKLISAPTVEETALLTKKDVEIFIGRAEHMAEKDRIVRAILKKHKGAVVYINVRVIDRPTWRGLDIEGQ